MSGAPTYRGPLAGVRVIEFAGIGPAPFATRLMGQLGAEVLRISRATTGVHELLPIDEKFDFLNLDKATIALDLKSIAGLTRAKTLIAKADVIVEGFRPGVMERQGLSPENCFALNEKLIYGRVTGWGQDGPMAKEAGHDINYIALSGALHAIGHGNGGPVPPLNLIGDFAGGGLYLVIGILAALTQVRSGGKGQVVDAAMLDGATHLMSFVFGLRQASFYQNRREANQVDGGFPFNAVYQTSDGKWLAVAAAEMKFRLNLLRELGLDEGLAREGNDPKHWPDLKARLAAAIATETRAAWHERLAGKDCCISPVLDLDEVAQHPQQIVRGNFEEDTRRGIQVPRAAPKFSDGLPMPKAQSAEEMIQKWMDT